MWHYKQQLEYPQCCILYYTHGVWDSQSWTDRGTSVSLTIIKTHFGIRKKVKMLIDSKYQAWHVYSNPSADFQVPIAGGGTCATYPHNSVGSFLKGLYPGQMVSDFKQLILDLYSILVTPGWLAWASGLVYCPRRYILEATGEIYCNCYRSGGPVSKSFPTVYQGRAYRSKNQVAKCRRKKKVSSISFTKFILISG